VRHTKTYLHVRHVSHGLSVNVFYTFTLDNKINDQCIKLIPEVE